MKLIECIFILGNKWQEDGSVSMLGIWNFESDIEWLKAATGLVHWWRLTTALLWSISFTNHWKKCLCMTQPFSSVPSNDEAGFFNYHTGFYLITLYDSLFYLPFQVFSQWMTWDVTQIYLDFVFLWNPEHISCFKFEQLKKENLDLDRGSTLKSA